MPSESRPTTDEVLLLTNRPNPKMQRRKTDRVATDIPLVIPKRQLCKQPHSQRIWHTRVRDLPRRSKVSCEVGQRVDTPEKRLEVGIQEDPRVQRGPRVTPF